MSSPDPGSKLKQVYKSYLTAVFRRDYYQCVRERTQWYSTHVDFVIGIGAAASGGTGFALLSRPEFAWLSPGLATATTILTIAKGAYKWPDRLGKAVELEQYYENISAKYKLLVEDIQITHTLSDEAEAVHLDLRSKSEMPTETFTYNGLSQRKARQLQNDIKQRIAYKAWWLPDGSKWS
jgi:hypothetical protein